MISYFYIFGDFALLISRILFGAFLIWFYFKKNLSENQYLRYFILLSAVGIIFGWLFQFFSFLLLVIFVLKVILFLFREKDILIGEFLILLINLIYTFLGPGYLSVDWLFKIRII